MIITRSDIEIVCRCPYGAGLSGTGGCPETRGHAAGAAAMRMAPGMAPGMAIGISVNGK